MPRNWESGWHANSPVTEMARVLRRHKWNDLPRSQTKFLELMMPSQEVADIFEMAAHQRTQRAASTQRKLDLDLSRFPFRQVLI